MGSGASKKHAELKSNLDSIKLELEACQKAKYELEESYSNYEDEEIDLNKRLVAARERLPEIEVELQETQLEYNSFIEIAQQDIQEAQTTTNNLQKELDTIISEVNNTRESSQKKTDELNELIKATTAENQKEISDGEAINVDLNQQINQLKEKLEGLNEEENIIYSEEDDTKTECSLRDSKLEEDLEKAMEMLQAAKRNEEEMLERMQYFKDIVKNERDPKLLQAGASHHQLKSQELVKRRIEHGTKTMLANMKQETLPSAVDLGSPNSFSKSLHDCFFL
eukprot:m.171436 g.171436  ORF g.171436 m.171436 type:complete len:281 (+) comp15350_c0_seq11:92-934(+)